MSIIMDKELLIRIPTPLYKKIKSISSKEYKSLSALVRELLLEKVEEYLTMQDMKIIEEESKLFHKNEGTDWKKVKRG